MAPSLVLVVMVIYAVIAVDQWFKGNLAMTIVWGGYSVSNLGLWMVTSK